ncbi:MAG TPA: ABC transporter ATP-binding protein [Rhodopila sp.]
MTAPLLEIRDLRVDYMGEGGPVPALHGVDLTIAPGETLGIVGESGCGKSTLISAILRLMAANARVSGGSIRFDGRDMLALPAREMRLMRGKDISIVFQDPMQTHNPVIPIGRQLIDIQFREPLSRREKYARAVAMLEQVELSEPERHMRQYPFELSGGMRQRLAIAMAMLCRPRLLIADEPTTALDATLEIQILDKLRDLQRDTGCAVIFISHHLGAVARLCERVMVMYRGHVVEEGRLAPIFAAPAHAYTRALMECDPAALPERRRILPSITDEMRRSFL